MKNFFFIVFMVVLGTASIAVQPARKPFLQIKIDGKVFKNGEIQVVKAGQKLVITVELEGGRRDYCLFPDTYSDLAGNAQILSRGNDGLSYEKNGVKSEWKLVSQRFQFIADENITINAPSNSSKAELTISNNKFTQSYVKISAKSTWQFTSNGEKTDEVNVAESLVYFKIAGSSDEWYSSSNIRASGMKNDKIQAKLSIVQAKFDTIENHIYKLNFASLQQSIKALQTSVNDVKNIIDEVKSGNAGYMVNVIFIGLPSDKPFNDIGVFTTIKTHWSTLDGLLQDLKLQAEKLSAQATNENKSALVGLIEKINDWQFHLPDNTLPILQKYIPELNAESIQIPANIHFIGEEKMISDYPKTLNSFKLFLDERIKNIPDEIQKINYIQSKLQAVRLFDGMLRSYFSSINWAEWKNTRE